MATHALTAGAIGTLTLGMMARVTLGHTGRPIDAPRLMSLGFVAITVSALLRVLGPWLRIDLTRTALIASGVCWSLAFAIYLAINLRALLTPETGRQTRLIRWLREQTREANESVIEVLSGWRREPRRVEVAVLDCPGEAAGYFAIPSPFDDGPRS